MPVQRPTALVADDNHICRIIAVSLLERFGFLVVTADNGREALTAAADNSFAVILMDCDMPEVDGLEATLAIRQIEQLEHALIIGVTSRANRQDCLAVGMDDHIQKPLTLANLLVMLKRWGWQQPRTEADRTEVRQSLKTGRQEIDNQASLLTEQQDRLRKYKADLAGTLWAGTSKDVAAERQRLLEWEEDLKEREWVLHTREKFLKRREVIAAAMDEEELPPTAEA